MELLNTRILKGEPPVLQVDGEIDFSTAEELQAAIEKALADNPTLVVDMEGVTFFDAAGLRVLLQIATSRNGAGPLTLVNASPWVKRVLEIVGLSDLPSLVLSDDGEPRDR